MDKDNDNQKSDNNSQKPVELHVNIGGTNYVATLSPEASAEFMSYNPQPGDKFMNLTGIVFKPAESNSDDSAN